MSENAAASRSASASGGQSASDIDKILAREATAFQREVEVERILKAFKLKYVAATFCHYFGSIFPVLMIC